MTESSTTTLRRLLDERGVKYVPEIVTEGTLFVVTKDVRTYYILAREKGFEVWSEWLTPAQVIAATLGTETCHMIYNELADISRCESCGWRANGKPTNFCPNCGRRVVSE